MYSKSSRAVARCLLAGMAFVLLQQGILPFVASPGSRKDRMRGSLNQGPQDKVFRPLMDETWTVDPQAIIETDAVRGVAGEAWEAAWEAETDTPSGAPRVGFGHHQGSTFEDVLDSDPYYCKWLLKQDALDSGYVAWLQARGEISESVALVPSETERLASYRKSLGAFGDNARHLGVSFRDVYEKDAAYCKWVKDVYNDFGGPGENVRKDPRKMKFGYWLAMQDHQAEDGKHEGVLYQDVLDSYPYYSQWLLKRAESRQDFVEWLKSEDRRTDKLAPMDPTGDTIVDFLGSHAGETYDEVYLEDKPFCSWCTRTSLPMNHVSEEIVKFGSWLRTSRKR